MFFLGSENLWVTLRTGERTSWKHAFGLCVSKRYWVEVVAGKRKSHHCQTSENKIDICVLVYTTGEMSTP